MINMILKLTMALDGLLIHLPNTGSKKFKFDQRDVEDVIKNLEHDKPTNFTLKLGT